MSLQWQLPRDIPPDTAGIGQVILPPGDVYRQIGEHFDELLPDENEFAPLYETTGRGAISPLLLALVTVFQMLEKIPDRLAARMVVSRIDWKYALHLPLTYAGFHFCDLSAFRARLLEHQSERMVFEGLLGRLKAMGLLKPAGKGRTDSTHVLGLVERLSVLELVTESIRLAVRWIEQLAPEWAERHLPAIFTETYDDRQSDYGLSQVEVEKRLVRAGQDGFWLLGEVKESGPAGVLELGELETLGRVLEQQFPVGKGGKKGEKKGGSGDSSSDSPSGSLPAKRPMGREIIESPHETEARHAAKRGKFWIGYKVQLTETCEEGLPHLVVDLEATGALEPDAIELGGIQARLIEEGVSLGEQYVDQGYTSGENIAKSEKLGIELVGLVVRDTQERGGFKQEHFQVEEDKKRVICPAGEVSVLWSERGKEKEEPGIVNVRFAGEKCQSCGYFGECTSSLRGRQLELHAYRDVLYARRVEGEREAYRERLKVRAGVEGTISEVVRGHGLRRARYRGLAKLRLQGIFTAVAVNLKRLAAWWAGEAAERGVQRAPAGSN